jgi:hypothetical protein
MSERRKCQTGLTPEQARAEHDEMMVKALEFAQQDRDHLAARVAELEADCKFLRDSLTGASEQFAAELAAAKAENRKLRMTIGVLEMKEKVKGL